MRLGAGCGRQDGRVALVLERGVHDVRRVAGGERRQVAALPRHLPEFGVDTDQVELVRGAAHHGADPALDLAPAVLPELGERLGKEAMEVLAARGVEVRLGVSVE